MKAHLIAALPFVGMGLLIGTTLLFLAFLVTRVNWRKVRRVTWGLIHRGARKLVDHSWEYESGSSFKAHDGSERWCRNCPTRQTYDAEGLRWH